MQHRPLGRTGRAVSAIGLGTWQLGADWGAVDEADARAVLAASVEQGVTLFDTADVYGDGRSETIIGGFLAERPGHGITVATKMGRRLPQEPGNYSMENFRAWTDRSRRNLGVDTLDLVQLHCPPTAVYGIDRVFDDLDTLVSEGVMASYGVSVELVEEALAAIARPNVATVQIILNAFRLKPLEQVLPAASEAGVGIIARVPLASGLLSGRYTTETTFAESDHRSFNRKGESFDVGETFSGVPFEVGVEAAGKFVELAERLAPELTPAQTAIAWIWQQPGVSSVIPGARSAEQARLNAAAGSAPTLGPLFNAEVRELYDELISEHVHERW